MGFLWFEVFHWPDLSEHFNSLLDFVFDLILFYGIGLNKFAHKMINAFISNSSINAQKLQYVYIYMHAHSN